MEADQAQALASIEESLSILVTRPKLEGLYHPIRVYLNCHDVLNALGDPRAGQILQAGYQLVQERANKTQDENLRHSYLENVAENREIVALWEETHV
jgi:hypothetical protein